MDDLISRQVAIDGKISIQRANGVEIYSNDVVPVEYLKALPSAQPEQKTGKWIPIRRAMFSKTVVQVKCSECGNLLDLIGVNCGRGDANYCPNCGARMEE